MVISYAIVTLSLCSLRAEPSHKSEMVSQLLLGELCTVVEEKHDWCLINNEVDGYKGWILRSSLQTMDKQAYELQKKQAVVLVPDAFYAQIKGGGKMWVPEGARLRDFRQVGQRCEFRVGNKELEAEWSPNDPQSVVDMAFRMLNTPYLWGGKSIAGIDCSGFTQLCFSICGIQLLRDAAEQATMGIPVEDVSKAREGDLAFFQNDCGRIIHVGIVLKGGKIIHSSGRVRVDKLDDTGIYREQENCYSHKLCCIRRILP